MCLLENLKTLSYKYECEKQKSMNMEGEIKKLKLILEDERNKYEIKLNGFGEKISELRKLEILYLNEKEKCEHLDNTLKIYVQKFE